MLPLGTSPGARPASACWSTPTTYWWSAAFNTKTTRIELANSQALQAWLAQAHEGTIPDLDTEIVCTGGDLDLDR